MGMFETYSILISIIILIGVVFRKSPIPISLLLVMTGMLLSFIPFFPQMALDSKLVLDIFLPLLIYQISAFSSWQDYKTQLRPIAWLAIGHVIIITALIAFVIHTLIPQISWPMAFLLGAVISPPDDVAIVAIAEKVHIPNRVLTILKGEAMFNDATALILFRFALAAVVMQEFSPIKALSSFFIVVIAEVCYGFVLGNVLGKLRERIKDPVIHMLMSLLTPFLAYLPAERLGGCGVLATVVTGLIMQHKYFERFDPEFRLLSRSVWTTLGFLLENIIFLLVGLEMRYIVDRISSIPVADIALYTISVILAVIIGRFLCVFPFSYIPRFLFPVLGANGPPPWQYPFIISWAGMRGGISLAAALAIPSLPTILGGEHPRDLIVFIVFCVIGATLVLQGLTLPWLIRNLGMHDDGEKEEKAQYIAEMTAKKSMVMDVLVWLKEYAARVTDHAELLRDIEAHIQKYEEIKRQLEARGAAANTEKMFMVASEVTASRELSSEILEVERQSLLALWHAEKIPHAVKQRLEEKLDHRMKGLLSD
jgi:monovalent cation/hydrogen antiporter